jgi:PAS domain S-box-containing protein
MKAPEDLSKEQLIRDLTRLRARITELEQSEEDKKKYRDELIRIKAMFEGLFEFAPDAVIVVNRSGNIVRANKQAERLFGYSVNELNNAHHEILLPERFREKHMEHRKMYMTDPHVRPMGTGLELYGKRKDGSEFSVDIALGPLKVEEEMFVIAVIRDVSDRKKAEEALWRAHDELKLQVMERTSELSITNEELLAEIEERKRTEAQLEESRSHLEEQVAKRTAELLAANKELDAFSYSVAHDLRAPLRHINGFVELLKKSLAEVSDEKIHDYANAIAAASIRMGILIDSLLSLSQLGRTGLKKRKVGLDSLVREVVHDIQAEMKGRDIKWEIDELPDVYGDKALLRVVLANLVSNAVKYTSTRPRAEIKIGCKDEGDEFICSVKDSGVGFDMKYVDRLFGVFQRLHSPGEFEGIGIGLATVRRIIARHGGRTWAEGSLGQGAIFYFAIPKITPTATGTETF